MVRVYLIKRIINGYKYLSRKFYIPAFCFGGVGLLIGTIWILSDLSDSPEYLILHEIFDQGIHEQGRMPNDYPQVNAPSAPRSVSWYSPLARQCSGIDRDLQLKLLAARLNHATQRETVVIDKTNFGKRFHFDSYGRRLDPTPRVVVIHETVYSLSSALNTFQTPNPLDEDQVSYHTLIGLDGRIVDLVDPLKRAYGAGYSAFLGEWAITNLRFKGSINNFALHVSLETPASGRTYKASHSGYTDPQYDSLSFVLSDWMERFKIPPAAITTHRHVDLGGERNDPRSFAWWKLQSRLAALGDLCVSLSPESAVN